MVMSWPNANEQTGRRWQRVTPEATFCQVPRPDGEAAGSRSALTPAADTRDLADHLRSSL
jgi:hypothetical protein